MKKISFILVMWLAAATAFSQTSRRFSNSAETTGTRSSESVSGRTANSTGAESSVNTSVRTEHPAERQTVQPDRNESRNNVSYSRDESPRQTPESYGNRETSRTWQDHQRETVLPSGSADTPESVRNPSRQVPSVSATRPGNPGETVSHRETGNSSSPRQVTTGARQDVQARHDGSVKQGSVPSHDRTVYPSPRKSTEHRDAVHYYSKPPRSREYRSHHNPYRKPVHVSIVWTPEMQIEYMDIYPMVAYWHYPAGYYIETISAYEAFFYSGEVVNIYGQVQEVYYYRPTDEYVLYFGAYFPYHDFTAVIPGYIARKFSQNPELYFGYAHVMVTGLVTMYNGVPEIYVKRLHQIRTY